MTYRIAALYRFTAIADAAAMRLDLQEKFRALDDLRGTLLVAPEGINGTLSGPDASIEAMLQILHTATGLPREDVKFSEAEAQPFHRLRVRLKREIITFNQEGANPTVQVGTYVRPENWNSLLNDPEVLLLDTRNTYETAYGTFKGAEVPPLTKFTEFADYVRTQLQEAKKKKVAMFCTGGIRCEKASAFMLSEGFDEVYHLQGGILKYLEEVPADESQWDGHCYVFDHRVAVGHGLLPIPADLMTEEDRAAATTLRSEG